MQNAIEISNSLNKGDWKLHSNSTRYIATQWLTGLCERGILQLGASVLRLVRGGFGVLGRGLTMGRKVTRISSSGWMGSLNKTRKSMFVAMDPTIKLFSFQCSSWRIQTVINHQEAPTDQKMPPRVYGDVSMTQHRYSQKGDGIVIYIYVPKTIFWQLTHRKISDYGKPNRSEIWATGSC